MAETNKNKSVVDAYKSPARKLVIFFKNSRDKGKAKSQAAKYQIKLPRNRIRHMEKRSADLKRKIKMLEKELRNNRNNEQKLSHETESNNLMHHALIFISLGRYYVGQASWLRGE